MCIRDRRIAVRNKKQDFLLLCQQLFKQGLELDVLFTAGLGGREQPGVDRDFRLKQIFFQPGHGMADSFAQVPLPQPDFFFRCDIQCLADDLRCVPGTLEIRRCV